jgi:phosphatidylglycerophosphate synthase
MPSRIRLRTIFAPVVKLLARFFVRFGLTPNGATWLMLGSAIASVLILTLFHSLVGFGIFIFITGLLDGVDGAIARLTQKGSQFGGFFDSTMDRVSEAIIFGGLLWNFAWIFPNRELWGIIILFVIYVASNLISYTRARLDLTLKEEKIKFDSNLGYMGRSERLFGLFLISIFQPIFGDNFLFWGYLIMMISILTTAIYRFSAYRLFLIKCN